MFSLFGNSAAKRIILFAALLILALVIVAAVLAPQLTRPDPWAMIARPLLWPASDMATPLGTDILGRDILAGIAHGARVSLLVGVAASLAGMLTGILIGAPAGYFGGWVDDILMRITEVFQTFPPFLFTLVIVMVLGPSINTTIFAIALVSWPAIARMVRAEVFSQRDREYVLACQGAGMGDFRIIVSEILPSTFPVVIVTGSIMVATAILTESALAFLGLGDPNTMSWGSMIAAGRDLLRTAWYITAIPGVTIMLTVLAVNVVGDALNDALNPRLRVQA